LTTEALSPVEISRIMQPICSELEDVDLLGAFRALEDRLNEPRSYVTVCGETSTGKSSIINGLVGSSLMPVAASPTNAAVVHLSFESKVALEFSAVDRIGQIRIISESEFRHLVTDAQAELLRLRVHLEPPISDLEGLQIFDTPGYNSVFLEHEEVLRSFLPQSDVIIFVTSYRSGFGQVDQDLLEVIRDATADDLDIPVLLVINRVPDGTTLVDLRVQEMQRNASDCLRFEPDIFLVPNISHENAKNLSTEESRPIPKADSLWSSVSDVVQDPRRIEDVTNKLNLLLNDLLGEADSVVLNRKLVLESEMTMREDIEKQLDLLVSARKESLLLVKSRMDSIAGQLPGLLDGELKQMKKAICRDIDESNRCLGADDCGAWITGHAFEFEGRKVGESLEDYILSELEALNHELEGIANTAIKRIMASVQVKNTTKPDLQKKLARDIAQRAGGYAVRSFLKQLGGACGVPAGAGNLAKMIVKRVGGLFGKRFGQGVYAKIGRIFNKGLLQKLNVVILVIIETISYLHHVVTWQAKLKKEVGKAVDEWRDEVLKDFQHKQLPSINEANLESVHAVYDSTVRDIERSLKSENPEEDLLRMKALRMQIEDYRQCLSV